MAMTIPRIDEDVVVRVEKNESGSSLLVQQPQKPQALTNDHVGDYYVSYVGSLS